MRTSVVAALLAFASCADPMTSSRQGLEDDELEQGFMAGSGAPTWFRVVDGVALADDIVLGPASVVRRDGVRRFRLRAPEPTPQGIANDARESVMAATRWPNGVVPVEFDQAFPVGRRPLVLYALGVLERRTALRFPMRTTEVDAVHIIEGTGCWSTIGQSGGVQTLSLGSSCDSAGVVVHEFMHAVGWAHEQCRSDRNQHVTFHAANVKPQYAYNFDALDPMDDDAVGPYDFGSVMHYGAYDFSLSGSIVLEPIDPAVAPSALGQRKGPSVLDVASLNATYPGAPRTNTLSIALSASELRAQVHESGRLVAVDIAGPPHELAGATLSIQSSDRSIVETGGLASGVFFNEEWGGQRFFRITPYPKSGMATLTFRVTGASGAFAEASLLVTVGGAATNAASPFVSSTYYFFGDRVTFAGRTWVQVTLRDFGRYEPWGNQRTGGFTCAPGTCTSATPATYGSIKLFWVEESAGPSFVVSISPGADAGMVIDAGMITLDAGVIRPDAGLTDAGLRDAGSTPDAGHVGDAGLTDDAGVGALVDAGVIVDAGVSDAGLTHDAGVAFDAGLSIDAGETLDAGDALDSGATLHAGNTFDSGISLDAGISTTAGGPAREDDVIGGLSCTTAPTPELAWWLLVALATRRRAPKR